MNLNKIIDQLVHQSLVPNTAIDQMIIDPIDATKLSFPMRTLIVASAWAAALSFIGFLMTIETAISRNGFVKDIAWGGIFLLSALAMQRKSNSMTDVKQVFIKQVSLALILTGKLFIYKYLTRNLNFTGSTTLAVCAITAVTYPFYRISIDRFLGLLAVLTSILSDFFFLMQSGHLNFTSLNYLGSIQAEWLLNIYFLLQFVGVSILLTYGKIKKDCDPLQYALVFSLILQALLFKSYVMNGTLAIGLIGLISWIAGGFKNFKQPPLFLAAIGTVALAFMAHPSLFLALLLMILGYNQHRKILTFAGALLLPIALFLSYNHLDISPLEKSYTLIASGITLLLVRPYIKNSNCSKKDLSCAQK